MAKYFELKDETVSRIESTANDIMKRLARRGLALRVHISKGNSKIGKCLNISTMPVMTCGNCKACKKRLLCYEGSSSARY